MSDGRLVSCLCVTENRAAFMPWLLWNFQRQIWPHKELVVVDSSRTPCLEEVPPGVRLVRAPAGMNVPAKRNLAMAEAHGELMAWFDDDDWQHPERLSCLVEALEDGSGFAGGTRSWFVDLFDEQCSRYSGGHCMIFNGAGFWTEHSRAVPFDEACRKASDTVWLRDLGLRYPHGARLIERDPLTFWLCHDQNISNPRERRIFPDSMAALRADVGAEAWGDTDEALSGLRERLPSAREIERSTWQISRPARDASSTFEPRASYRPRTLVTCDWDERHFAKAGPVRRSGEFDAPSLVAHYDADRAAATAPGCGERARPVPAPRPAERPAAAVSASILVTAADAPYARVTIAHLLKQAQFTFSERVVVIGSDASDSAESRAALEAELDRLRQAGVIDRIVSAESQQAGLERYFRYRASLPGSPRPSRALTELSVLGAAAHDYVLWARPRLLFFASGPSWVAQALDRLRADPGLWSMSTQAGPPVAAAGTARDRSAAGIARARWDKRLRVWRLAQPPAAYSLIDRRKLQRMLDPVELAERERPLAASIGSAMGHAHASAGQLSVVASWALCGSPGDEHFADWAPELAALVERGRFPASQRGFELRLSDAHVADAWRRLLEQLKTDRAAA